MTGWLAFYKEKVFFLIEMKTNSLLFSFSFLFKEEMFEEISLVAILLNFFCLEFKNFGNELECLSLASLFNLV